MTDIIFKPIKFKWNKDQTEVSYQETVVVIDEDHNDKEYFLADKKLITETDRFYHGNQIRLLHRLIQKYPDLRPAKKWFKAKGLAFVKITNQLIPELEIHWYEHPHKEKGGAVDLKIKWERTIMKKVKITKENFFDHFTVSKNSQVFTESGIAVTSEPVLAIIEKAKQLIEQKDVDGFVCLAFGETVRNLSEDDALLLLSSKITENGRTFDRFESHISDIIDENPSAFSEEAHKVLKEHQHYIEQLCDNEDDLLDEIIEADD